MKNKTHPLEVLSAVGIVILVAFGGVVGRSCGKNAANGHISTKQGTSPPSPNDLKNFDVAGLTLLLPGHPHDEKLDLPQGAGQLVEAFESYNFTDPSINIGISRAVYRSQDANLDGAADGAISGVRNLSGVKLFNESKSETVVDGLAGREMKMTYMNGQFQMNQFGLVFSRGRECWQIQIIGEGLQNRAALENLKDAVFGSIKVSPGG